MTHRFFVDEDVAEEVVLRGEQAHQIANVLRLKAGDGITLVRNNVESMVVLQSVDAGEVRGRCVSKRAVDVEPRARLTLALPILRGRPHREGDRGRDAARSLAHRAVRLVAVGRPNAGGGETRALDARGA